MVKRKIASREPSPERVVIDTGPTGYILGVGSNDCGQLGIIRRGTRIRPDAPADKLPPAGRHAGDDSNEHDCKKILQQQPFTRAWWQARTVRQVAAGAVHSVCLLRGDLDSTSFTVNCAVAFGQAADGRRGIVDADVGRRNDVGSGSSKRGEAATTAKFDPDNNNPDYFPTILNLPADIIQIAAGDAFTAALTHTDGHVYMTGSLRSAEGNFACFQDMTRITGRRNLRNGAASAPPRRVAAPHIRVTKLVAGSSHIAILDEVGNVYTMGRFQEGQLGRIEGAKKKDASSAVKNSAQQLQLVTATRTQEQMERARLEQLERDILAKKEFLSCHFPITQTTSQFSDVWATRLGLFLRDAEIDAVYACGSNSVGQLGLPVKWHVTTNGVLPSSQPAKQAVGYLHGRRVVRFRQKPTVDAGAAETVDNLLKLDITVELPTHVPGLDDLDIVQIVGSEVHTLALTRGGEVYVFGSNKFYALGLSRAQLCASFTCYMNQTRLSDQDVVSESTDTWDDGQVFQGQLLPNDELIQERLKDPIFVAITRLLPPAVPGKAQRGGNIALRRGQLIESIAVGSHESYFITRDGGRLYRCGENNNKLMFIRDVDELKDDKKYVKNVDYLARGSDVKDVALVRPLLYENEVLRGTNGVLSIAVGGQHALLLVQRNH